ncbi:MAG: chemotaxis protein CheX [Deltaproteobacteria bacterium]|nr:chemotaxis protein CheX [Deltaproteobacteria bacterium]
MSEASVTFIKNIISAIIETIEIQCERKYTAAKAIKEEEFKKKDYCVSGVIGVTSEFFTGSVALVFTSDSFLDIMSGMMGEEYESIDDDLVDGCAELLNIAYGTVKKKLNEHGYKISMAIPSVVYGDKLKIKDIGNDPSVKIPFCSGDHIFLVSINFENSHK